MALKQVYTFGGIDTKSSEINREEFNASDAQNVEFNSKRELIKRKGYDELVDPAYTLLDIFQYDNSELLVLSPTGVKKLNGTSLDNINYAGVQPVDWTLHATPIENKGNLYWNDPSGTNELWKYDGYMQYRAGVPAPEFTQTPSAYSAEAASTTTVINITGHNLFQGNQIEFTSGPNKDVHRTILSTTANTITLASALPQTPNTGDDFVSHYYISFITFIDLQGNTHFSDFVKNEGGGVLPLADEFTIKSFHPNNTDYDGFYNKYGVVADDTVNSGSLFINVSSHNYVVGDFIGVYDDNSDWTVLEIDVVSALTQENHTTAAGSTTTVINDTTLTVFLPGMLITFVDGPAAGETSRIISVITGTSFTVDNAYSGSPGTGDTYYVERGTITFTAASVGTKTIEFVSLAFGEVYSSVERHRLRCWTFRSSVSRDYGYVGFNIQGLSNSLDTSDVTPDSFLDNIAGGLSDYYSIDLTRILPPKAKVLGMYQGTTMVAGDIFDEETATAPSLARNKHKIKWSTVNYLPAGVSIESFEAFYEREIGQTEDGPINGLYDGRSALTILKEKQVYYIGGILQDNNFRPISAQTERVGCVAPRSVIGAEGGCLFMSDRGIYFAGNSTKPVEISQPIEPTLTEDLTLDLTNCISSIQSIEEKVYFFIPTTTAANSVIWSYDYKYKAWFKHTNIIATNGLMFVEPDLYHTDGDKLFKSQSTYLDELVAIDAYYATTWHHMGIPSIRKKFINFIILSIGAIAWTLNIRSQKDWDSSVDSTDETLDIEATTMVDDHKLDIAQCKSMRFLIRNNVKSEGMLLTGYEFEYESTQIKPKGES